MKRACLALLAVTGASLPAAADTITLRNGWKIEGKVLERSEGRLKVRIADSGVITLNASEVESVEENARTGAEMAKKAEQAGVSGPATGGPTPAREDAAARGAGASFEPPPPPPDLEAEIAGLIERLGATRHHRHVAAGLHQDQALEGLARIGWPAIPALRGALHDDANWFRRENTARTLARIARGERDARTNVLLWRSARDLMDVLARDAEPWPRIEANLALEAITGAGVSKAPVSPQDPPELFDEAARQWQRFWEQQGKETLAAMEEDARSLGAGPGPRPLPAGSPR